MFYAINMSRLDGGSESKFCVSTWVRCPPCSRHQPNAAVLLELPVLKGWVFVLRLCFSASSFEEDLIVGFLLLKSVCLLPESTTNTVEYTWNFIWGQKSTIFDRMNLLYLYCIVFVSFFFYFYNWSIVDLQCCVNFCCATNLFGFTYILFFKYYFPLCFIIGY